MIKRGWLLLSLLFCVFGTQAETILVVESYHAELQWDQNYIRGLEEVLGGEHELVYFELDAKRLTKAQYEKRADEAWKKYQAISPALVVLADDDALRLLGPRMMNTDTPVVYMGINANPRQYGVADAPNISGVIERPVIRRSILMLKKFIPVKRLLVLFDNSNTSQVIKQEIFYGKDSILLADIRVDIKLVTHFSQWREAVLTAKEQGYDALIADLYLALLDENGNHADPEKVIQWTSTNTEVPPFSLWAFSIGVNKSIGGNVIFAYDEGKQAAEMVLDMLAAEKDHRAVPQSGTQGRFVFSKSQLTRWGIELPPQIYNHALFVD